MIFQASGPVLLKKLYFCDFPGEGPDPLSPSGSAHGSAVTKLHLFYSVYLNTHARAIYPDELQELCFA